MAERDVDLPAEAYGAALSTLPGMGPARLAALVRTWSVREAWERVGDGTAVAAPLVVEALGRDATTLPDR